MIAQILLIFFASTAFKEKKSTSPLTIFTSGKLLIFLIIPRFSGGSYRPYSKYLVEPVFPLIKRTPASPKLESLSLYSGLVKLSKSTYGITSISAFGT